MSAPLARQPGGSAATQGSSAAEGTAWAARIIEWPVPHSGAYAPMFSAGKNALPPIKHGHRGYREHARRQAQPPGTPALQDDRPPLGGEPPELAEQVARVSLHERAQLGRAGHSPGCRERLGQFGRGELAQCPLVDALGVGADREHQHHVAQVHRLPPGGGTHLGECHVDQQQLPVTHHEVARFDVAVGDPGVPQPADHREPLVDQAIVNAWPRLSPRRPRRTR